ncbi:hypothetical protein CIK05_00400 [Bdellovibrio sp. qaytius]|nr:hypothetical protein CIK05_00400 [Bdellovibrio sp. qaytius]
MIKFFLILLLSSSTFAAGNVPDNIAPTNEGELRLRYLQSIDQYTLYSEIQLANQSDNREFKSVLAGSYYRFYDNLRAGLFYQRQYGVRHNEDWFKDPASAVWHWRNADHRGEDSAVLDISPKMAFENFTVEFKFRYEHGFFNSQNFLRPRLGLTYFWLGDNEPVASAFVQAENLIQLKNGKTEQRWLYIGGLYHYNTTFQIGAYKVKNWQQWNSTAEYAATTGQSYSVESNSRVYGIMLIVKN